MRLRNMPGMDLVLVVVSGKRLYIHLITNLNSFMDIVTRFLTIFGKTMDYQRPISSVGNVLTDRKFHIVLLLVILYNKPLRFDHVVFYIFRDFII